MEGREGADYRKGERRLGRTTKLASTHSQESRIPFLPHLADHIFRRRQLTLAQLGLDLLPGLANQLPPVILFLLPGQQAIVLVHR